MKSNASGLLELWHAVYKDASAECPAAVSDLRDWMTIQSRTEREGLSFLTITLPSFARDLERALEQGRIDRSLFRSFRKSGAIPAFLQGMLGHVFSRETGDLLDVPLRAQYVKAIRQVCLFFKRFEVPCTLEREAAAIQKFTEVEQSIKDFTLPDSLRVEFLQVCRVLWDGMLGVIRPDMLVPRHGPGATAERISGNGKYVLRRWHERLEPFFPVLGYGYSISAYESQEFEDVTFIPEVNEQPVRVVTVPKTLKSPRVIAIEPVCMQYAQQAVKNALYKGIETFELTRGHVNFTDQGVNQKLALAASIDGRYSTIDLSDASDRVIGDLALEMFSGNPDLQGAVEACRSYRAELPDGTVVGPLAKFASMGSALCFPVESMYFYTICVAAALAARSLPCNHFSVRAVTGAGTRDGIFVYGDDIIVPTDIAGTVLDYLQKYNCKVNDSKTFVTGRFRESCGVDAYEGTDVTPLYLRSVIPQNRQQASELAAWTATANAFYHRGYWQTADLMFRTVEMVVGSLPYVPPDSSGLGRISLMGYRTIERWNGELQRYEMRAPVLAPVYSSDEVNGYAALQKSLLALENFTSSLDEGAISEEAVNGWLNRVPSVPEFNNRTTVDRFHLERSVRRGAVTLKRRWVPSL